MNLLEDAWIPVIRQNNKIKELIRPCDITDQIEKNPVTIIDAPRPDFNGALIQFLIGIIQTIITPKDEGEWLDHFLNPPSQDKLFEAMKSITKFFNLDGDGPRFMQDMELESDKPIHIGSLLIDSPGENTNKLNTDHFVKRGGVEKLCQACSAMALFALNTNAPSGGAGHRTSLRGGGPLTTIAIPEGRNPEYDTLWHKVWLNILIQKDLKDTGCNTSQKKNENKFPWIASIKTSEKKGSEITPDEINPMQIYWSMPRRIRLEQKITETGICDICGVATDSYYTSYVSKPYGINYGNGILHPLSPYYSDKDGLKLPVHPQPGGFTYRHWPDFVSSNNPSQPRAIVLQKIDRRLEDLGESGVPQRIGVYIFGYDMDNMKARCWYETIMPYWLIPEAIRDNFYDFAKRIADAARQIATNTRNAIKSAWFDPNETVRGDFSYVVSEFWNSTESAYYEILIKIKEEFETDGNNINKLLLNWIDYLNRKSLDIYDYYADQVSLDTGVIAGVPRVIKARDQLIGFNLSKNIRGKILGLPETEKIND